MRYTREYNTTVDVADPVTYCLGPEAFVRVALEERYVGRCKQGAFVLSVGGILRRSACRLQRTNLKAHGTVSVSFEAEVVTHARWGILPGVAVRALGDDVVGEATREGRAAVSILGPTASALRVGDVVSVRVAGARHPPNATEASVAGLLLTCERGTPVYALEGALAAADVAALAPFVARARALLAARAALQEEGGALAERLAFIEGLLYSYAGAAPEGGEGADGAGGWRGPPALPLPAGAKKVDLLEAAATEDFEVAGLWARDLALHRTEPAAARAPGGEAPLPVGWKEPVARAAGEAFREMLQSAITFLEATAEMAEIYAKAADAERHEHVWALMRRAQLPPPRR